MNTLILYASKYGTTAHYAREIAKQLFPVGLVQNVQLVKRQKLAQFDRIILGTPIYSGQPRTEMRQFCHDFQSDLLTKQLYLFATGLASGDRAHRELLDAFPTVLHNRANATIFLGGALEYSKLQLLDKGLIKLLPKVEFDLPPIKKAQRISKLDPQAFMEFTQGIQPFY